MCLLGVQLEVLLDAGLEKSQFGLKLLRLGEQPVLEACQVGVVMQQTESEHRQIQGEDLSACGYKYILCVLFVSFTWLPSVPGTGGCSLLSVHRCS